MRNGCCAAGLAAAVLLLSRMAAAAVPETVTVHSADAAGTPLKALLYKPDGAGPFPAVVMMHGCAGMLTKSGKLRAREAFWTEFLVGQGYVVLAPDGFNPRGFHSMCKTRDRPLDPFADRPYDAYGALAWLQAQPYVRADRVVLIGWSNGAMAALATLAADAPHRPKPPKAGFRAGIAFYPGCIKLGRTGGYTPSAPMLLLVGLKDDWTLPRPCFDLVRSANARGASMEIEGYEGAYHAFDHPNLPLKTITTRNSALKGGEKTVHTGSNPEARAKAIARVKDYLAWHLKP